jgi:predicted nucleic acid-binding protein
VNLLDTDVLSHLQKADSVGAAIAVAMSASPDQDFRITTINAYEMLDGAFGLIQDLRKKHKALIPGLQLLQDLLDYFSPWQGLILRYDDATEQIYRSFAPRLRQELKNDARIAAIALTRGAAVWTCNVGDYKRVPGLTVYAAETGVKVS